MRRSREMKRSRYSGDRLLRPELLWRLLCYGLLILCLATAETSFFAGLSFLPATPDLLLGAVVAVSLLDHRRASLIFAMVSGLALDAIGGVGIPLTALIYVLLSQLASVLGEKMLPKYGSYLVLLVPSVLLREGWALCELLLLQRAAGIGTVIRTLLLPDGWVTLLFCLPLYGVVKLAMLPFCEKR